MLPRIPLDDRTFESILHEARRGISQRLPEWTDENTHDPGMTILELFAWLSEMQQFYLSRVPERNLRKFLDLLGVSPLEASSAEAEVSFGNIREPVVLPRGTKLLAEDQLFETLSAVKLLPLAIDRIVTRTELEASDRSASNTGGNVAFYAFGREAGAGSRLYIAFDREPVVGETISMHIRLADDTEDSELPNGNAHDGIIPSARVAWKIFGWEEELGASWLPLDLLVDETRHLTYSGRISFEIATPVRPVIVHPAGDRPRYWISCTLEESGYELPPRIDRVLLNTTRARQQDTKSEQIEYDGKGVSGQSIVEDSYLARYGKLRVQVREQDGRWREWNELSNFSEAESDSRAFVVEREFGINGPVTVRFGDSKQGAIPPEGKGNIRRIHYTDDFASLCWIGRSNGLPHQKFQLFDLPCKWREGLLLQVGVREADGELLWEDWEPVDNFDRSGPLDRHYVYDPGTGQMMFGNDENGAIPSSHEDVNLCVTSCVLGGGERGNIKPHLLNHWVQPELETYGLTADNAGYGVGGREGETLEMSLERAQQEWQTPYCAVTNEDYVRIAKSTPGLKVSRVHVIPDYAPGREDAPGAVTVVVVPQGLNDTPMPSAGFLGTVAKHLDDRRLITTEVNVIAPEYIKVTVHAIVVVEPHYTEEAHRIVSTLNRLLTPLDKPDGIQGWPFGRTVHKGDIYGAISRIKGVAYVQDLWLDAEGRFLRKSAGGDIVIPGSGIVYSGEHRIELISRTQL